VRWGGGFRAPGVDSPSWGKLESVSTWAVTDTQALPPGFTKIAKKLDDANRIERGPLALQAILASEIREPLAELVRIILTTVFFQSLV